MPPRLNKNLVRHRFERAASRYDQVAFLQREVGNRLNDRILEKQLIPPDSIVDIGTGTGYGILPLLQRYPDTDLFAIDIAFSMLDQLNNHWEDPPPVQLVCTDMEFLPFVDNSISLSRSNLALQWSPEPGQALAEWLRVLKPGGSLFFTTFGTETLKELRHAWLAVDTLPHVHTFPDLKEVGNLLSASGWCNIVMDRERFTLTYQNAGGLIADLKALGATHAGYPTFNQGLGGKKRWQTMIAAYESQYGDETLPATFEVLYGYAEKPGKVVVKEPHLS